MSKEIAEEYASSLADLTVNSKPLINMLTILAEENIDHAAVIVETVEKHLEKVQADIKLPVLYLVDSIIKNVGGAYVQKFSQIIVNMFTRTFKQVDEKIRSQMFKLRETWHDVFPATKLYQLDVKVNLIDPAWPIQAQPQQSTIHVNPNFLKKPIATSSTTSSTPPVRTEEEEAQMRTIVKKKEQELLMLQRKKIEMELEQAKRQLDIAEKNAKKVVSAPPPAVSSMPIAMVNPVVVTAAPILPEVGSVPIKQRLGPPVSKTTGSRITPVSGALASARRDPRLARRGLQPMPSVPPPPIVSNLPPPPPIAPNVFDIKPLGRSITKRKNVITIDVRTDIPEPQPSDIEPHSRLPRRNDPRLEKRDFKDRSKRVDKDKTRSGRDERVKKADEMKRDDDKKGEHEKKRDEIKNKQNDVEKKLAEKDSNEKLVNEYIDKLQIPDPKKINKLPPIPKINRDESKHEPSLPNKRKKENPRNDKKKKRDNSSSGKDSSGSSPEKKVKNKSSDTERKQKPKELKLKEQQMEVDPDPVESEVVTFKELKNYSKERYMRRNKEKSQSPENIPELIKSVDEKSILENKSSNVPDIVVENKDIDLRILHSGFAEVKPAPVVHKRPSSETFENKPKKNKLDKFDILFGSEDVDLRQLPHVEETQILIPPPPPPISITQSPKGEITNTEELDKDVTSPNVSPKRDRNDVKENNKEIKKSPTKLDLVRAKLAEATKVAEATKMAEATKATPGKDRLGRPLLFSKSPSVEKERRRTLSTEDTDLRTEISEDFDPDDHKKSISIIMSQAKQQYKDGDLDKNQYNTLMYQVLQLNEKLKLKEAKQRESLEISKKRLKAHIEEENQKIIQSKSPEHNKFGDIDERIPPVFMDTPPNSQPFVPEFDMNFPPASANDVIDGPKRNKSLLPFPLRMPLMGPFPPMMRGQFRPRMDDYPRRMRSSAPPFFRGKFDKRGSRIPFEPIMPLPPFPIPTGMCQGESPLIPYERSESPPPLGAPGIYIPQTDFRILEYIDQDPMKTIQIDSIQREIRFYGDTAVIMLDWDDPREIKFLPGSRRVTFDNKDSIVLSFGEGYKQVEIDDQTFDVKFGAPTRELFINGRWFECFFGGQPLGAMIDGKPRLIHLEGPLPQVDIGKTKRTDLVAGKINLIVDGTHMCPVFLDAKIQKFLINGNFCTIRFVDALRTVLINEQPFKIEFGGLPKPIFIGNKKHFIRFSVLPRHVKPGYTQISGMEGSTLSKTPIQATVSNNVNSSDNSMETEQKLASTPVRTPSPEGENQGLDMLASLMPTSMAPSSGSEYLSSDPFSKPEKIPGLETPIEEKPQPQLADPALQILNNINVNDLFAKLVATGIVQVPKEPQKEEPKEEAKVEEVVPKVKEDKTTIHHVDFLKSETLRVKQPGLVAKLYGGMQCSGCGARFPPEHTVRYSQHLDWHFRQNRRERDSTRRAHSRHWHYDVSDWVQYEEVEDLEEREKSWFETGGAEGEGEGPQETAEEAPSVPAGAPAEQCCALCGDKFDQFYNEDKEEWHLRKAVRHEDKNYHPLCFEDYKTSLTKEEPVPDVIDDIAVVLDKSEEAIEIKDVDDDLDQSDNESVVEVVETEEKQIDEPVEIDEGDEDDVVLKAEPVEEVVVDDEGDTDDETTAERAERDRQAQIDFSKVKIKQEPIDPDDEPIITAEEEPVTTTVDMTHTSTTTVLSSIDGNVQLDAASTPAPSLLGGIRINISKSIPSFITNNDDRVFEDISGDNEPLPPGEEPELEYKLKPSLEGVQLSRQPPLRKGNELSGLCSIM